MQTEVVVRKFFFRTPMSNKMIRERRDQLNRSCFPSEMWFRKALVEAKICDFRRNVCLFNRFFGDFVWRSKKLVVEIDGKSHDDKKEYDRDRDAYLAARGYKVIRINFGDCERMREVIESLKITVGASGKKYVTPKAQRRLEKAQKKKARKKAGHGKSVPLTKAPKSLNRAPKKSKAKKDHSSQLHQAVELQSFCQKHALVYTAFNLEKTVHVRCGHVDFWPSTEKFYCHKTKVKLHGIEELKRFLVPDYVAPEPITAPIRIFSKVRKAAIKEAVQKCLVNKTPSRPEP